MRASMALRETVVEAACDQRDRVEPMLLVLSVMGVLLLISFLFLEPGTASYNIAIVDLVLLVTLFVGLGALFYFCTRRQMD